MQALAAADTVSIGSRQVSVLVEGATRAESMASLDVPGEGENEGES
jgi:hypothetical protein